MRKYKGARSIKSSSRKRSLGKVKINYNSLVKKEVKDYLNVYGAKIKDEDPEKYYSMIGRKLPKKYLKEKQVITPVNAYVPPQSKLSPEELDKQLKEEAIVRKQKEQALWKKQQEEQKEKERLERNRAAYNRERKYIYWCNPNEQGNYVSIHSDRYKKKEKKYKYYW